MGRTGALKHVHRYMRTFPYHKGTPVWECTLDGCTHYMPTNMTIVGRKSQCWQCGDVFFIEVEHLKQEKPTCNSCANPVDVESVKAQIKELWEKYNASTDEQERATLKMRITLLNEMLE